MHVRMCARLLAMTILFAGGFTLAAAPAEARIGSPSGLSSSAGNPPPLSWSRVAGAMRYDVQVDDDSGFGSPEFSQSVYGTHAVPTGVLRPGDQFWRVRAVDTSGLVGSWAISSFDTAPVEVPSGLTPDGTTLQQPDSPPLLSWNEVPGAQSYVIQIDDEEDPAYVGAREYTTKVTSFVVPDALPTGDSGQTYRWRVKAIRGSGVESAYSPDALFTLSPLDAVTLTSPADDAVVQDVVLDWERLPGAAYYELQVSTDDNFSASTVIDDRTGSKKIYGTTYSPTVTYDNNTYYWRVRAVDTSGNPSAWSDVTDLRSFVRSWSGPSFTPDLLAPADGATFSSPRFFLQWTPVRHAAMYEVQMGTDPNFSPNSFWYCRVAGTTYTPLAFHIDTVYGSKTRIIDKDCLPASGTKYYWRVRPLDTPFQRSGTTTEGVQGVYSATRSFTYTMPATGTGTLPLAPVSGIRMALNGNTIGLDGSGGFAAPVSCTNCSDAPSTPVISWQPVSGADFYMIYISEDPDFTNIVEDQASLAATYNTFWTPNMGQKKGALAESLAGGSYYLHIRPCIDVTDSSKPDLCNASPISTSGTATNKFRKKSPAVKLEQPAPGAAVDTTEVTFDWQDYRETNASGTWGETNEAGVQSAMWYRIQVDDDANFASPIDTAQVDQSTYTAFSTTYPEGPLYWRVQAIDAANNDLTWSETRTFRKASPSLVPVAPAQNAVKHGTTVFRWQPAPFASSYDLELYKNNDTTFSSANRVFTKNVKQTAYAWDEVIPSSATPYVWRVRSVDGKGNKGPWTDAQHFTSAVEEPQAKSPDDGTYLRADNVLLTWSGVPGATDYRVELASPQGSVMPTTTKGTAFAPNIPLSDGIWQWRVSALSSSNTEIGSSGWSRFEIDEKGPQVLTVGPDTAKPTTTFKITFNERVTHVSARTIFIKKSSGGKVRARLGTKGSVVTINPAGRLRRQVMYTLTITAGVKDRHGHAVTPYQRGIYIP